MSESSCGRACELCPHRRAEDCPGCAAKPGQDETGFCELARARRERGEQACSQCGLRVVCCAPCGSQQSWVAQTGVVTVRYPVKVRAAVRPAEPSPELLRLARAAGPLLWVLFGVTLAPFAVERLLAAVRLSESVPQLPAVLILLCRAAAAAVLFLLSRKERGYRAAAVCDTLGAALNAVCLLPLPDLPASAAGLAEIVLRLVSFCIQCRAHGLLAERADPALTGRWRGLRRWTLAAVFAPLASLVLLLLDFFLSVSLGVVSVLLMLFTLAAVAVIPIVFLVFLGQTAARFSSLAGSAASPPPGTDGPRP